jgi:hypothetical protein
MRLEPWTREEVIGRFREAGDTVKRLPKPKGPASYGSGWPGVVQDARDAYGYTETRLRLAAPTPRAIDRMDEVFDWFRYFSDNPEEMRVVWLACGCGVSFAQCGRILGMTRISA